MRAQVNESRGLCHGPRLRHPSMICQRPNRKKSLFPCESQSPRHSLAPLRPRHALRRIEHRAEGASLYCGGHVPWTFHFTLTVRL